MKNHTSSTTTKSPLGDLGVHCCLLVNYFPIFALLSNFNIILHEKIHLQLLQLQPSHER